MMKDYNDMLNTMLDEGKTPEAIYQDTLSLIKERNAKKAEEKRNKEIAEAREKVAEAIKNYITLLTGKSCSEEFFNEMNKSFDEIEKEVNSLNAIPQKSTFVDKEAEKRRKEAYNKIKAKREMDDFKTIHEFLKSINAL